MRYYLAYIAFTCTLSLAAQNELSIEAKPEKVTVFLSGAQIFQSKNISLSAGSTDIIVEGISNSLDVNSIQAGGTGDFVIMDVQYRNYYPEPSSNIKLLSETQKKIQAVSDSLTEMNFQLKDLYNKRDVLNVQKTFLMNNKLLIRAGERSSDSLKLLQQSIEYYDSKLNEVYAELLNLERKELTITKQRDAIAARMAALQAYQYQNASVQTQTPIPQIIVTVYADHAASGKIEINYITYNAGWVASYDIRASDINSPIQLNYKANIWQQTGIDWDNVKLTCSTGNPMYNNALPELTTWYLQYYKAYYDDNMRSESIGAAPATLAEGKADKDQEDLQLYLKRDADAQSSTNYTSVNQNIANVDFEVNLKYSVPADGKNHVVALQTSTLQAAYNYLVVPKVDQSAFLIVGITEWENTNLLPGYANIYYKNTYMGKTNLNPLALSDTLQLSLGRDMAVEVKRTQVSEKSKEKLIGSNTKKTLAYEITIRNGKANDIDIVVKDQIPVSQDSGIKVETNELSGAEVDDVTGIVTWKKTLKAKELIKYEFGFEVTYPKNQIVSLM